MITYDRNYLTFIEVNDKKYILPNTLEGLFENDELLNSLTIKDLINLYSNHFGIPDNFIEYINKKVSLFDSLSLSSFIYNGKSYWLDKETRDSIKNLITASYSPDSEFNLILDGEIVTRPAGVIQEFLDRLSKYSYECLVTLTKHKNTLKTLHTLPEILEFDYTTGYPEKLTLE